MIKKKSVGVLKNNEVKIDFVVSEKYLKPESLKPNIVEQIIDIKTEQNVNKLINLNEQVKILSKEELRAKRLEALNYSSEK
jgi:hypothetical protein